MICGIPPVDLLTKYPSHQLASALVELIDETTGQLLPAGSICR